MKKLLFCLSLFCSLNAQSAEPPFSDAVRAGSILYISGQTGYDTQEGVPVPGGIEPQTKQALKNIKKILRRYGLDMADVKKCTVMLANIQDWEIMNNVYATFFPKNAYPARTTFGNSGLANGNLIEIDCIARFDDNNKTKVSPDKQTFQ